MDAETLSLLEFPQVLKLIGEFTHSSVGKAEIASLTPSFARKRIEHRLRLLKECVHYTHQQGRIEFIALEDPRPILQSLSTQREGLDPGDFLTLFRILTLSQEVQDQLCDSRWPLLSCDVKELPDCRQLATEIERVLDPGGEVKDTADPELATIRLKQSRSREKAQEHLQRYFSSAKGKYLIEQPYITLRNGRCVIPIKVEHQKNVTGVVHATSSSGATLFVEPFTVVTLNNECLKYEKREQEIVQRVLRKLNELLSRHREELQEVVGKLAALDALFACADFSLQYDCTIPRFGDRHVLKLQGASHPLLVKRLGSDQVVPISIELDPDKNVLVISGPNAGGKTVALKTIGLLAVMAQSGLPVCARQAEYPLFEDVLADIGDHQSINLQLSTFSAHVVRMRKIVKVFDASSLILLDELGTGTDPVYGSALGIAIVDFFRRRGATVVATTHHQAIKAFATSTPGIENASVKLDPNSLKPTYELQFGMAGESSALEIAAQLGLNKEIISRARSLLTEDDLLVESHLQRLRDELDKLGKERQEISHQEQRLRDRKDELEAEFEQQEKKRRQGFEKMAKKLASEFQTESRQFIRSVKDRFEAARIRKEAKRKETLLKERFRRRMEAGERPNPSSRAEINKGDWVIHSFFRKQGKVISLESDEVVVEIEGKRISASIDDLDRVEQEEKGSRELPANVSLNVVEDDQTELNLVGFTVEEALITVDKFLDRAFISSLPEVRIIHGFGKGVLRSALAKFLGDHPHVKSHRVEGGVTVVGLQQ